MKLTKSKLREIIKEELLGEAKPPAYIDVHNKMYKAYENFAYEVNKLSDFTIKADGDSVDAKIIRKNFKKQVIPFIVLMKSWLKGKIK
jgi:hypothetical protein